MQTNPQQRQLDLFSSVLHAYSADRDGRIDNATLYRDVAAHAGIPEESFMERSPVGTAGQMHSILARQVRWHQQSLKHAGILSKVENERGWWELTKTAKKGLSEVVTGVALVGFSTDLGVAILGHCDHVFTSVPSQVTLVVTSPPYPLARNRAYGNAPLSVYVDWFCKTIKPVVDSLAPNGSICINLTNDKFMPKSPARSTYLERIVLALEDQLGLHLMDRIVWSNPSKAPSPVKYASIERTQLNVGYEPVLWFAKDPHRVKSNNRRVLMEHTSRHLQLIARGGEKRDASYSDGSYSIKAGRFGNETPGRIPKNVLTFVHACKDQRDYKKAAKELGLPVHGAPMPLSLAKFLISFLSEPGDLIADPFGGS